MAKRVRTPVVQQMERTECGAACLGMILGYFGRWVPLAQLRIDCGVSRDGSRAGNLVRAARRYGLEADGYKVELAAARDMPVPFVAFWAFNHFVVVEGIGRRKVHLNDPAVGRRTVSWAEFDHNFTGVIIAMAKGPGFQRGGNPPSVMAGMRRRFQESRSAITFLALVSLTLVVPGILVPNFGKLFVDYFLVKKFDDWLRPLLLGMVGTAVLQMALTALQQHYLLRLETRLSTSSSSELLRKMLRLPLAFFSQRNPSELAFRCSQTEGLAQLVAGSMGTAILAMPAAVLFSFVMLYFDIYLGGMVLVFAGIDFAVLAVMARTLAERNQAVMIQQNKVSGAAASGLRMIADYKASGTDTLLFERITGLAARQENLNAPLQRTRLMLQAIPAVMAGVASAALFTLGGERVMSGHVSVGVLVAFQALMANFMGPVAQLVGMGQQVQNAQAYMVQIDDMLGHPSSPEFAEPLEHGGKGSRRCIGQIELRGVSFGYSPLEPPLIQDVGFAAAAGEWVAVVGRTGSGKSTVARLIAGMESPWQGEVLIDGKPVADIPRAMLRNSVSVVDQNVVIFEGSVRDNITMWDPTVTEEAVVTAAKLAGIHDLILSRQGGYDARLSEDGGNLSGGQRTLLDLARAIVTQPSVLVLDEATAALDAITEEQVMLNLRELGCTCVVIAHRLSTIRDADRIVVVDGGRIAEMGTHGELLAQGGLYRDLVENA